MNFYEAMQLGTYDLKQLIKNAENKKIKRKYINALIVKDFLCLLFCMIIVMSFSIIFGNENSIAGVVTVIALLTFRFSNLDFDVRQSTFTILSIFGILIIGPYLANMVNPLLKFIINFISIMTIVVLSCNNIALCNHVTLILSYLLLYGYDVSNINVYVNRVFALILGGCIVSGIFYIRQRKMEFQNKISDIINNIDLKTQRTKWQLKISLGICSGMMIGEMLHLPRSMWIGFSCMSILHPNQEKLKFHYKKRVPFLIIGCLIYYAIYWILPIEFREFIGIIGGIMVGISATYEWQTVFNCFGALTAAIPIFGLEKAIILRILNNAFGSIYSRGFNYLFNKFHSKLFYKNVAREITGR